MVSKLALVPLLALLLLPAPARAAQEPLPRAHWANALLERIRDRDVRQGRPGFAGLRTRPMTRAEAARIIDTIERRGEAADWRDLMKLKAEFAAELAALSGRVDALSGEAAALERDRAEWGEKIRRAPRRPDVSFESRLRHESTRFDTVNPAAVDASNTTLRTRMNVRFGGADDPVSAGGVFDLETPRRER